MYLFTIESCALQWPKPHRILGDQRILHAHDDESHHFRLPLLSEITFFLLKTLNLKHSAILLFFPRFIVFDAWSRHKVHVGCAVLFHSHIWFKRYIVIIGQFRIQNSIHTFSALENGLKSNTLNSKFICFNSCPFESRPNSLFMFPQKHLAMKKMLSCRMIYCDSYCQMKQKRFHYGEFRQLFIIWLFLRKLTERKWCLPFDVQTRRNKLDWAKIKCFLQSNFRHLFWKAEATITVYYSIKYGNFQ